MSNNPLITPAAKPVNSARYKPSQLSSSESNSQPLVESNVPETGNIVPTLLKIALKRLPGFGYGAIHGKAPSVVKDAVKIGSHGNLK